MTKNITVQAVTTKEGQGARGKWIKHSICDENNIWYSTFNTIVAEKGKEYTIEYEEGKYGNDLKSIQPVNVNENQIRVNNKESKITRMHSQEMAIRWIGLSKTELDLEELRKVIDWFDEDVETVNSPF